VSGHAPALKRLVLVRHGETAWNVERRLQGQTGSPLTVRGLAQAEAVAVALARRHPGAAVVASDLERALRTAEPLAARLGVSVAADGRLRERHCGTWEGRTRAELAEHDPVRLARWRAGEDVLGEVGGESDAALRGRAGDAFALLVTEAAERSATGTVIAVSHGGTISAGLHALLGLGSRTLGAIENASVSELVGGEPSGGSSGLPVQLVRLNETGHLQALEPAGA
jgi:glucosyl-3-phosphoglycerate phosphatase